MHTTQDMRLDRDFIEWRVRDLRTSARQIAQELGVATSTISRWLSGQRGISHRDVKRLGYALNLSRQDHDLLLLREWKETP